MSGETGEVSLRAVECNIKASGNIDRNIDRKFDKTGRVWLLAPMHAPRLFGTLDPFLEAGPILGRKVANAGFLDALLAADPFDAYHFFLPSPTEGDAQRRLLEKHYPDLAKRGKFNILTRLDLPRCLSDTAYAVFHLSDCIVSPAWLAAVRNAVSREIFPITAPIHSLSYAHYGREFLAHLWPGTTPRDAVVATSSAGLAAVEAFYASLRRGYGLTPEQFPAPSLVRIPLGVEPGAYGRLEGDARDGARERLGLDPQAVILLVLGRISHSSKMDLVPLLRAIQRLAGSGIDPAGLCLVAAGWPEEGSQAVTDTLSNLAANIGLRLRLVTTHSEPGRGDLPGLSEADKRELLGVADIFVSLADNPQETFGLTLLEAMAAGLPVVASDYDGYRDIVADGRTGFLVPSLGLPDTDAWDVLAPLCYDSYTHLFLAQGQAVDVPGTAAAIKALILDPGLRRDMGRAGRLRVEERFSWRSVIARHLALWDELAARPVGDRAALGRTRHPAAMAYGELFAGYPTRQLTDALRLTWSQTGQAVYRRRDFPILYTDMDRFIQVEAIHTLLFLSRSPCPALTLAARLAAAVPGLDLFAARYHVTWAVKQDLLEEVRS